jgi:hypothetical protein
MPTAQQLFDDVVNELRRWGNASRYTPSIALETELFHDLRIYGDDLYEFVIWLNKKFGVETNIELGRYAPPEIPFLRLYELIRRRRTKASNFGT